MIKYKNIRISLDNMHFCLRLSTSKDNYFINDKYLFII